MNRIPRLWIVTLLVAVGCATKPAARCCAKGSPRMVHVIVCWLKTPGDEQARQKLIDATRGFQGKIPGLVCVSVGRVVPSTRPSVDSTYDVAAVMTFVDESALIEYGKNPIHQQAIRDVLKPLVDHYVIYDFVDK